MAHAQKDYGFTAIRVEGALLPPEYLQTINALNGKKQASTDYGLTKSLNIKDEIGRYWRMASDRWSDYQERRKRTDMEPGRVAIETWLRPLFEDILGYHDIVPCPSVAIGSRHFPIGYNACASAVPLVLTGHTFDLDRADMRFGDEGRRRPPHGLLQEYLNAADTCLWGMVSNGNLVRLVRDNPSLTRPAFIEADLERMFAEQLFSDFAAFWLTFHVSRLAPHDGTSANCILEAWRTESIKTGERARENLRKGVTAALHQLGNGFLEHPANDVLRKALSNGEVTETGYFQELLRLVYRLLFLFTVEDRNLLFHPEAAAEAHGLYTEGYSLSRLRDRALKRRHYDQYGDLWEGLRIVFSGLARGMEPLGLPALGGLFADDHCPRLDACAIANNRLLQAIHALAFFESGKTLARVNYRDMGTEELGSVYESLLELHPTITVTPWKFGFIGDDQESNVQGSERKTSGSYYTPPVLVNELIKSALIPVIEQTLKDNPEHPREALLELNVVDPACGSGHFLLAAARHLAAEISRLEAGLDTPGEALRQHALREVVQHCIYGVDKNPLAVELCKTALWIETVEPGKPLSFLDHHIQCGNSLLGTTPALLAKGIPDDAFRPIEGDIQAVCNDLKNRNKQEHKDYKSGQGYLFEQHFKLGDMPKMFARLTAASDNTMEDVAAKQQQYKKLVGDVDYQSARLLADAWCAVFVWKKTNDELGRLCPTERDFRRIEENPLRVLPHVHQEIKRLCDQYQFFHWHLAFPDVFCLPADGENAQNEQIGWNGGFDVVLGNPPWEMVQAQELDFFADLPEIAKHKTRAARQRAIASLETTDSALYRHFNEYVREISAQRHLMADSGRFRLGVLGRINIYKVMLETGWSLISPRGRLGMVVPSGIAFDDFSKDFFSEMISSGALVSLFDFENRAGLFPAIDSRMKFCLLTITGREHVHRQSEFAFFLHAVEHLSVRDRRFVLSLEDITLLNPNTHTCPIFRTIRDAELCKKIYRRLPIFVSEVGENEERTWGVQFGRIFNLGHEGDKFTSIEALAAELNTDEWLPLYEGKMFSAFNHRAGSVKYIPSNHTRPFQSMESDVPQLSDPLYQVTSQFYLRRGDLISRLTPLWSKPWLVAAKDVTSATNERTVIASILPCVPTSYSVRVLLGQPLDGQSGCFVLAMLNSYVFDWIIRQFLGGLHLQDSITKQAPVISPAIASGSVQWGHESIIEWVAPRVVELSYTVWDLEPFAKDCGYYGPPFRWDGERRFLLRCELDAAYFHLYGIERDDVDYIMETFPITKRKDEAQFGEYRTKRVILDIYNAMQQAITTGESYRTRLDPPPADPHVAHEAKEISTRPS